MRIQDFIAEQTLKSMEGLLRQAKSVPADKLGWKPVDEGRSVLSQLAECAVIPSYMPEILATLKGPEFSEEMMAQYHAATAAITTLEDAEVLMRENTAKAVEAMRRVTDADLEKEISFFGPNPWKICAIMQSHDWNLTYHTGQICYIQTLLGDHNMN